MQGVSALKGLEGPFLFGAMGPLPAGAAPEGSGAGAACRLPDLLVSSLEFIHLAFLLCFCLLGKPCIDYWAFITVQLEG